MGHSLAARDWACTTPGCGRLCSSAGCYHFLPATEKNVAQGCTEEADCVFWRTLVQSIRSGALCTHGNGEQAQPWAWECHKYTVNSLFPSLFPRNSHCHFLVAAPYILWSFLDMISSIKRMVKYALWGLRIYPWTILVPKIFSYQRILIFSLTIKGFKFTWDFQTPLG